MGGGFPETNAPALSGNEGFIKSVREAEERGVAFYAECGGLMFLGNCLEMGGERYPMTGILPLSFKMEPRPVAHGYTIAEVEKETSFYPSGLILKGHEFHYSRAVLEKKEGFCFVFKMKKGKGIVEGWDGVVSGHVFGTYTHLHALGATEWIEAIINTAGG
jgi:cobyrinic acid a,c-diamide synthase